MDIKDNEKGYYFCTCSSGLKPVEPEPVEPEPEPETVPMDNTTANTYINGHPLFNTSHTTTNNVVGSTVQDTFFSMPILFNNSSTKKPMSKVTNFIKNLTLSKREKLFRGEGLKNDCGNYTDDYEQIALHLLCQDMEERVEEYVTQMKAEEKKNKKEK